MKRKLEIANSVRYGVIYPKSSKNKVEIVECKIQDKEIWFKSSWHGWVNECNFLPICKYDYFNKSVEQILKNRI